MFSMCWNFKIITFYKFYSITYYMIQYLNLLSIYKFNVNINLKDRYRPLMWVCFSKLLSLQFNASKKTIQLNILSIKSELITVSNKINFKFYFIFFNQMLDLLFMWFKKKNNKILLFMSSKQISVIVWWMLFLMNNSPNTQCLLSCNSRVLLLRITKDLKENFKFCSLTNQLIKQILLLINFNFNLAFNTIKLF